MTEGDESLISTLAMLGGGIDDAELDQRVAGFREAIRRLRDDPAEATRVDALVLDAERDRTIRSLAGAPYDQTADDQDTLGLDPAGYDELLRSLRNGGGRHPSPEVDAALRQAAETLSIERVADLAVRVTGTNSDVEGAILRAVVLRRSIAEIFTLAHMLAAYSTHLASDLLNEAAGHVHERNDGGDAADFIDRVLSGSAELRGLQPPRAASLWRRPIAAIIDQIAEKRDPGQLMSLIAGLAERRRLHDYHREVEGAVARHYRGAELAALPLVCRQDHLPAVLNVMATALQYRSAVKPEEVPAVVRALHEAGAPSQALGELLTYIGGRRLLDCGEMVAALRQAGMEDEARWVQLGNRRMTDRTL